MPFELGGEQWLCRGFAVACRPPAGQLVIAAVLHRICAGVRFTAVGCLPGRAVTWPAGARTHLHGIKDI